MKTTPPPRLNSWEISDEFWSKVEPLIPQRQRASGKKYFRDPGAGRKPIPAKTVFAAIVYVLRTGIQWKAIPKAQFGSPSAIHRYFLDWQKAGFFLRLWKKGLAEYDELAGIAWEWQSIDGAMHKAPLAKESVGPNPTDRGKKWDKAQCTGGRPWRPAIPYRQRSADARREVVDIDT